MILYFNEELVNEAVFVSQMFEIIKHNMEEIFGESQSSEADYEMWKLNCINRFKGTTILLLEENKVIGYLQYGEDKKNQDCMMIYEIEIIKSHQHDHKTFYRLIHAFIHSSVLKNYHYISAYINEKNDKSRSVFTYIGMKNVTEKYYVATKNDFEKYLGKHLCSF